MNHRKPFGKWLLENSKRTIHSRTVARVPIPRATFLLSLPQWIRRLSPLPFSDLIHQHTRFLTRPNLLFDFNRIPFYQQLCFKFLADYLIRLVIGEIPKFIRIFSNIVKFWCIAEAIVNLYRPFRTIAIGRSTPCARYSEKAKSFQSLATPCIKDNRLSPSN